MFTIMHYYHCTNGNKVKQLHNSSFNKSVCLHLQGWRMSLCSTKKIKWLETTEYAIKIIIEADNIVHFDKNIYIQQFQ